MNRIKEKKSPDSWKVVCTDLKIKKKNILKNDMMNCVGSARVVGSLFCGERSVEGQTTNLPQVNVAVVTATVPLWSRAGCWWQAFQFLFSEMKRMFSDRARLRNFAWRISVYVHSVLVSLLCACLWGSPRLFTGLVGDGCRQLDSG